MTFFVPGVLVNPLNGSLSRAHWTRKSAWANGWKDRTRAVWRIHSAPLPNLAMPKRITFLARVGAQWDDDNLPAALKPCRDALIGYAIHSDAPTAGHVFKYRQVVDRTRRGVQITVEDRS